jgi:hypothetical protein
LKALLFNLSPAWVNGANQSLFLNYT